MTRAGTKNFYHVILSHEKFLTRRFTIPVDELVKFLSAVNSKVLMNSVKPPGTQSYTLQWSVLPQTWQGIDCSTAMSERS